jgi:hypothetical protein
MVAVKTSVRFPERRISDKTFQIIAFLVNDSEMDIAGI